MITAEDLTRRFGSFVAVEDASFHLDKGEVVGFLGLNGAGKTTTMRMLTGYLPPTSGTVRIAGFDVLRESLQVRRRIGYLPESVPLYREHRVGEMLRFQARLHGMARADAKRRAGEVLEQVGLTDRERTLIGQLSKGLRQRAGLAVALLPDPEVLILDEPTSGLDPIQRAGVRKLIRDLAVDRTVLLSSHILPEVEAVCPRVIILHGGRVVADGAHEELVRQLGDTSHVRVEAMVGLGDEAAADAKRLLAALPGVERVEDHGRLGIHRVFTVFCGEDLREDVGALAAAKSWALRELSWSSPTLEQLFARIALGHEAPAAGAAPVAVGSGRPTSSDTSTVILDTSGLGRLPLAPQAPPAKPKPAKQVYNLNPFELGSQGAVRDLGAPKQVGGEPRKIEPGAQPDA